MHLWLILTISIQILKFSMHKFMQMFNSKHKSKQVYFTEIYLSR